MLSSRALAGLLVSLSLACEVSTPPAGNPPSTAPAADSSPAAQPSEAPPEATASSPSPEAPRVPPFEVAAGLHYREVVIGSDDPEATLPMVVAIHGLGDDPDNFRELLQTFDEPCRVILPRGLDEHEPGWSWFPIRAADPDVEALSQGIANAADRIAEGLAALQQSRPTRGLPVVTGFSQGGMLTFTLAVRHPEVVGAAIAIGGWLPPPLVPEARAGGQRYPFIHALHGTTDRAVAYEPTLAAVEALEERGFQVELHTYEGVGHTITPQMQRDLFDQLTDAVAEELRRKPSP